MTCCTSTLSDHQPQDAAVEKEKPVPSKAEAHLERPGVYRLRRKGEPRLIGLEADWGD